MMLLSPDVLIAAAGPVPDSVINKRPLWYLLIGMLAASFILRMLTVDILGCAICALLLCFAVVVIRDGMKELPKLGLVFGLLCGVNFLFYVLPVVTAIIAGRSERKIVPLESLSVKNIQKLTYTLIIKTTPFFDKSASPLYKAQSCGMIVMPVCMLLGSYLGMSAHCEIYERSTRLLEGNADVTAAQVTYNANGPAEAVINSRLSGTYGAMTGNEAAPGIKEFQGAAHKLGV